MRGLHSIKLHSQSEERKKEETHFAHFMTSWFGTFMVFKFLCTRVLLFMKTLQHYWYVVIKAYKITVFEILRDLFVLSLVYRTSMLSLLIKSTDSTICQLISQNVEE